METWYGISKYDIDIMCREAIKSTHKTITFPTHYGGTTRRNVVSSWERWFKTERAAIEALLKREKANHAQAVKSVQETTDNIAILTKQLKEGGKK